MYYTQCTYIQPTDVIGCYLIKGDNLRSLLYTVQTADFMHFTKLLQAEVKIWIRGERIFRISDTHSFFYCNENVSSCM